MNPFIQILMLSTVNLCRSDCIDNRSKSEEWEKKLHSDLSCNYQSNENPSEYNITVAKVWFYLKSFQLDSENDVFSMYSWTNIKWTDERLTWDPSKYGNITSANFISYHYWCPCLMLNNRQSNEFKTDFFGHCTVKYFGSVTCVPRMVDSAQCQTALTNWPYDTQKCTLEYGICPLQKNVHLIIDGKRAVTIDRSATFGSEWTIVYNDQHNNENDSAQLKITFTLVRNVESVGVIIIYPSVLLSLLTASSILLDVIDKNRLLLMIFGVMCHCFCLSAIGREIPKHGAETPTILLLYRFSIVFNVVLVVITIFLMKLRNRASVPPSWVSKVSSVVLNSHGYHFLWPRWEADTKLLAFITINRNDVESWNVLANIINSVCSFATVLLYSIMMFNLIPRPQSLNLR